MENIRQKLIDYISRSITSTKISGDDNLFDSGLIHSLFAMQLIMFIEKEFGIELEEDYLDFEKISTINEISKIVFDHLEEK